MKSQYIMERFPVMGNVMDTVGNCLEEFDKVCCFLEATDHGLAFLDGQEEILAGYTQTETGDKTAPVIQWYDGLMAGIYNISLFMQWLKIAGTQPGREKSDMSLAAFKRMASEQPVYLEVVWRFGSEIPASLKGKRRIAAVRSYGFDVERADKPGEVSRLDIAYTSQFYLEAGYLYVFSRDGLRTATDEEQRLIDAWNSSVEKNGYGFWPKEYSYLSNAMAGAKTASGSDIIKDKRLRGSLALKYQVLHGAEAAAGET